MARHQNNGFKDEYCQLIVDMFSRGASLSDFCVKVGKGRSSVYRWTQYYKEFKEAYELAREYARVWRDDKAIEWMTIDTTEGAINYDVKAFMRLTSRRFADLERESPPPKILDKKKDPDLYKAAQRLIHETVNETITPDQSKVIGNLIKSLLEVKEKEQLADKLEQVERILSAGQQTNNIPVNSPEPEFEVDDDNQAE